MAFKLPSMTRETSTTTLTGDILLSGAQAGYYAVSAGLSNGDTSWFTVKFGSDEETGLYTYNSGANSLTRTTIYRSTNANAAVSWPAGTKDVICGLPGPSDIDSTGRAALLAILGTSSSATALVVGPNGATNPALQIDASAGSLAAGVKITGAAAAAGAKIAAISSQADEALAIDAKGAAALTLNATGTGNVTSPRKLFPNGATAAVLGTETFATIGTALFQTTAARNTINWIFSSSGVSTGNHVEFYNGSGLASVGSISSNGTNTTYSTSSDERLKFKFDESGIAWGDRIDGLWVGDFEWRDGPGKPYLGVRAQQAVNFFPQGIVHDAENDRWTASYGDFAGLALWGVKDLRARVTMLERELAEMKAEFSRLRKGLDPAV